MKFLDRLLLTAVKHPILATLTLLTIDMTAFGLGGYIYFKTETNQQITATVPDHDPTKNTAWACELDESSNHMVCRDLTDTVVEMLKQLRKDGFRI